MKLILIGYHGGCEFGFAFDDGLSWMMAFRVATVKFPWFFAQSPRFNDGRLGAGL